MANPNVSSDMAQFFDFGEAAMPELPVEAAGNVSTATTKRASCPAHGDHTTDGCLCHGFHDDFTVLEDVPQERDEPEWNNDFSSWIPRYHKPDKPCEYCRSRSLECFIYNAGGDKSAGCSPCNALFRPCSFNAPERMPMQKSKTALDTLDVVTENNEHLFGGLTGKKQMRSLGHMGPIEDELPGDKGIKKGAAAARFPRTAVKILKDWMIEHIDHPYPTDEEKEALKAQTGLTISQISNWMANTRRRQKARPKRSASPSIRPSTEAINIPPGRTWESLNPFERWKHSPPENEPAPMMAIAKAVETFDPPEPSSLSSSYHKGASNDSTGSFSIFRAPSISSLETGFTNMSSGSLGSHNSAYSYGSRHSLGSLNSLNSKKERRRRRRVPTRTPKLDLDPTPRMFQCTFCTDRFKSKYDWSRHEKSLHLSLEKWICAPLGEVITCSASGRQKCVYCDELDPSKEHLTIHNHSACEEKGREARTFYRKDHLRQHLRLMHGCKMTTSMESWKSEAQYINSRCGFCTMTFNKWQDRTDHLAKEFRSGANMKDWKGCRGLDPHVAALVTNAMPPYLIANESKSPFPFSATNSASMKHHNLYLQHTDIEFLLPAEKTSPTTGIFIPHHMGDVAMESSSSISPTGVPSNTPQNSNASVPVSPSQNPVATCWEILTLRLGRFARKHIEQNGPNSITDEMLQRAARHILYDEDDPWNQTAADNLEWLNLFKKAHGIDTKPWHEPTSQHEIREDLGVRPNALLDKSFDLSQFECVGNTERDAAMTRLAYECSLSGSMSLTQTAHSLASGQETPFTLDELLSLTSTANASNIPATTYTDYQGLDAPIEELACTTPGGPCIGENGEIGFGAHDGKCSWIMETPCGKSSDPFLPAIKETPCSKSGEPTPDHFTTPTWDQLPDGFELPTTTGALSSSMPVTSSVIDAGVVQGDVSSPKVMRWDEAELGFGLMDVDLDLNVGVDLNTGMGSNN